MNRSRRIAGFGLALLTGAGCTTREEPVGRFTAAIVGGVLATEPFYQAVACGLRRGTQQDQPSLPDCSEDPTPTPGWDWCARRCEINTTLITPTIAVAEIDRLRWEDSLWDFGYRTGRANVPPEQVNLTAFQIGFGPAHVLVPPDFTRYVVMAYEQRLSGVSPYCPHPWIDIDPTAGEHRHYIRMDDPTAPYPPRYSDAEEAPPFLQPFWGANATLSDVSGSMARLSWTSSSLASVARGTYLRFTNFSTAANNGTWVVEEDMATGTEIRIRKLSGDPVVPESVPLLYWNTAQSAAQVSSTKRFANQLAYEAECAAPLAVGDAPIGRHVFFLLSERVDESLAIPIPIGMRYPDGSTDAAFLTRAPQPAGDVVGFGAPAGGNDDSIRRVALSATRLSLIPTVVRAPDGTDISTDLVLAGDGGSGAGHVDFSSPWLLEADGKRQVFAVSSSATGGENYYYAFLSDRTAPLLQQFLDPDGDGVHRGFIDARLSSGAARPGYVDADGDGLSEYRVVTGTPGVDGCIEAVPPLPGQCWMPTRNDNCGPPPGAGPMRGSFYHYSDTTQRDRDGDGVGDVCDVCPAAWDASQQSCPAARDLTAAQSPRGTPIRRGEPVGLLCARRMNDNDDGDGFLDAFCDNCPGVENDQTDSDGDGLGDACDICPDDPNPDQDPTDEDGDSVPDACDNCPPSACDDPGDCANAGQDDADGDGVGDVCDNCWEHPNAGQDNCNEDAERAQGLPRLGDACDEAWCPQFHPSRVPTESTFGPLGHATTVGFSGVPVSTSVVDVRTGFRFCGCDTREDSIAARQLCALQGPGNPGCVLDNYARFDNVNDLRWHIPQQFVFPSYSTGTRLNEEPFLRYAPPGPDAQRFYSDWWDFPADLASWGVTMENIGPLVIRGRGVVWGHGVGDESGANPLRETSSHSGRASWIASMGSRCPRSRTSSGSSRRSCPRRSARSVATASPFRASCGATGISACASRSATTMPSARPPRWRCRWSICWSTEWTPRSTRCWPATRLSSGSRPPSRLLACIGARPTSSASGPRGRSWWWRGCRTVSC